MYRLNFYVPESHLSGVKEALFNAGAGKIGHYQKCCWQVRGEGQFLPMENSCPAVGQPGRVEHVVEYKVEMVCDDALVKDVIEALVLNHPYEEPAYDLVKVLTKKDF
ncbi:MAG: NGG1p interacting factor NIF3 [Candidatus Marinimicrobia bacterium]|nr:NGG1p interacting factor NIF3 [Candidatus Neomarinimicrobiota bacterium]